MTKKTNIYLFGGNSTIGCSILDGIQDRLGTENIEVISFFRNEKKIQIPGKKVKVKDYKDALEYIKDKEQNDDCKSIFILSFGVLKSDNLSLDFDNFDYHLKVNTMDPLKIYEFLLKKTNFDEIHIVSSVLADFIRPSLTSYSLSKFLLSKMVERSTDSDIEKIKKVFTWKVSFVDSDLNKGRKSILIKTNPKKIRKKVKNIRSGGIYYIPGYSKVFSILASKLTPIIKLLDKKN